MSPTILAGEPAHELPDVQAGYLPARYGEPMQATFLDRVTPLLRSGVKVLDIGAGRAPTIAVEDRPDGCVYVGTDIDGTELEAAPPGAYDETLVADVTRPFPGAHDFDLVLSWQVLEHVRPLDQALANLHAVLRPGGTLVAHFSGGRAFFAAAARVVPHRVRSVAMSRLLGSAAEEKFPTQFDRCHASAIEAMTAGWSSVELVPFYRGAAYLSFARPLQRGYLLYEDAVARHDWQGLATHYLLVARA